MSDFYFFVGVSGSGKSTYRKQFPSAVIICPDDIRRELTGSVSDQSKNAVVFDIAYKRLDKAMQYQESEIIFDSTGLHTPGRIKAVSIARQYGYDTHVVVFIDSQDLDLCRSRVRKDIMNKVDRSDVPDHVMQRQHSAFCTEVAKLDNEDWDTIEYFPN